MTLSNDAAIAALAERLDDQEYGVSSHWARQLTGFAYGPNGLSGLRGFGTATPPRTVLHRAAHRLLQRPFRRMGSKFPSFADDDRLGRLIAKRQRRQFEIGMMRHVLTLSLLRAQSSLDDVRQPIVVIGDGFATMTALILAALPHSKVVIVNLTKVLLVDMLYLRRALPEVQIALAESDDEYRALLYNPAVRAVGVRAKHLDRLASVSIGVCINIASMQEMAPPVIAAYFATLRRAPGGRIVFYCCNRVEKTLPDGTIVRFDEYPWRSDDEVLLDELCPWHQFYYRLTPPFYRPYLGPIRHRLVVMAKEL